MLFDAQSVPYYLNEKKNWGLDVYQLTSSLFAECSKELDIHALVIINLSNL